MTLQSVKAASRPGDFGRFVNHAGATEPKPLVQADRGDVVGRHFQMHLREPDFAESTRGT